MLEDEDIMWDFLGALDNMEFTSYMTNEFSYEEIHQAVLRLLGAQ